MPATPDADYREASTLLRQGDAAGAVRLLERQLSKTPDDEVTLSLMGSARVRVGDHKGAMDLFRRNVELHPESYGAHGDLGFAEMQSGNETAAIAAFEKARELKPDFYQAHVFISKLRYAAGNLDAAKSAFEEADRLDPFSREFGEIQSAMSAERFAQAEKIARGILSRQPGHPKASYALAHLATTVGAHEESADILRHSIEQFPCDVNIRAALVNSLEETGDYEVALEEASRLAELDAESFAPQLILGRIHGHCGHYEESLAAYDRAIALSADDDKEAGNIELLRGHVLKILGRHDDGIEAYRKSISLVRDNGAGWWGLADMKTHRFSDADRSAMSVIAENEAIKAEQRTQAAFALGKAFEDDGNYAESFRWYALGNALRTGIRFEPEINRNGINELIETFSPDFLRQRADPAANGPIPIFITGLPRAGSTLVEQILASHSQIEGTMELVNLPNVLRRITIDGGRREAQYPGSLASFSQDELASYGQAYIDSTAVYRSGKPCFIDKMPTNFDKIGLISMILPNAVIIAARRHPMDCGFSAFKQHFAGGHHFSYDLEHIGHYYNDYLRLVDHWHDVLPGKVLTVQYEKVVANAEAETRRLLEHCGLPFEEGCLRCFENKRPVRTASSEQDRQHLYRKAVHYWQNFEQDLEPLKRALGKATLDRFAEF